MTGHDDALAVHQCYFCVEDLAIIGIMSELINSFSEGKHGAGIAGVTMGQQTAVGIYRQ